MKRAIGKFVMGIAAAVAVASLMSLSTQTAMGQLELVPNPGGTGSSANPQVVSVSGGWNYVYYMGITDAANNATSFTLSALDNGTTAASTSGGLNYSGAGETGSILNNFFQISDFNGYVSNSTNTGTWGSVSSTPPTGTYNASTVGDWVLEKTGTTLTMYYTGADITVSPANTALIGSFAFESAIGPGSVPSDNYLSTINNGSQGTQPPVIKVNTGVEVPSLPLPAAFWPGLMTLGSVAVIGGLRLRRRTV